MLLFIPALLIVNNTPGHLLIQPFIKGDDVIYELYGTDDGREVTLTEPRIYQSGGDGSTKMVMSRTITTSGGDAETEHFYSSYRSARSGAMRNPLE
jgi:hypothetical protein